MPCELASSSVAEELTIRVAQEAPGRIFRTVVDRGGGPFHFWLIHLTLDWPAGLTGLRLPSILFMLAALPAIALVADELVGRAAAAGAVLVTTAAVVPARRLRGHQVSLTAAQWEIVANADRRRSPADLALLLV